MIMAWCYQIAISVLDRSLEERVIDLKWSKSQLKSKMDKILYYNTIRFISKVRLIIIVRLCIEQ